MQKIKKHIPLLCCIVLAVISFCIIGLVGGVEGKYYKEFEFNDTISLPKKTYLIHFINNQTPLVDPIKVNIKEYEETDFSLDPQENPDIKATIEAAIAKAETDTGYDFSHWINLGSTEVDKIGKGNTEDIVLYPAFYNVYTAIFVNQKGGLLKWGTYTTKTYSDFQLGGAIELESRNMLNDQLEGTDFEFEAWEIHVTNDEGETTTTYSLTSDFDFSTLNCDVTIYPKLKYSGDVQLIPVDIDGNGTTDEYQVGGYNSDTGSELVEIPAEVNGADITEINAGAFDIYDDLHAVRIPASVTVIGSATFSDGVTYRDTIFGEIAVPLQRETVTLYYEGEPDAWEAYMDKLYLREDYSYRDAYIENNSASSGDDLSGNVEGDGFATDWDDNMGDGSRIFFVDVDENGNAHVNYSKGYWELVKDGSAYYWVYYTTVPSDMAAEYTGTCNCNLGEHSREDAQYWN